MFNSTDSLIICIDMQEKLVKMINDPIVSSNAVKLLKTASVLNIETIISEQYPKGLGSTIDEIKSIKDFTTIEKTTFSALETKEFQEEFSKYKKQNILIFGIETHICVLQSVISLLNQGYSVFVIEDCSKSRNEKNHKTAIELMKQQGAKIITLEIALFNFLKSSKHPHFKEIQTLIK